VRVRVRVKVMVRSEMVTNGAKTNRHRQFAGKVAHGQRKKREKTLVGIPVMLRQGYGCGCVDHGLGGVLTP